jgi:N-methylhydantoinase A/oxoprolinase/acetone carboxylase beta subunit
LFVGCVQAVLDADISSIAVVLKHAAIYPEHEKMVGQLAAEMGFKQVCEQAYDYFHAGLCRHIEMC